MAQAPDHAALAQLHEQLAAAMRDTDALITRLDGHLSDTGDLWKSKQGHDFRSAWHNGFKPSMTKLCQSLAMAVNDVAFEQERMTSPDQDSLPPVESPR